ncbi:hypothetical protein F5Y07DRAFT_358870 [Xylaria sp. FL0933]|nr:hypothetical protein F5Y07DRAFT_358870 [Xylaria sp. FL0933]
MFVWVVRTYFRTAVYPGWFIWACMQGTETFPKFCKYFHVLAHSASGALPCVIGRYVCVTGLNCGLFSLLYTSLPTITAT